MRERHSKLKLNFDRALSNSLVKQSAILAIALFVALGFSYLFMSFSGADWQGYCREHELSQWLLPLYLLIDSSALSNLYIDGNVHGWMLFASSFTFLVGMFIFNGVIIGIINNAIERRVESHREGRIHYLKSGHHIIMGYDDIVPSIIGDVFERDPNAYVLLLTASETPVIQERLKKTFSEEQMKHVIINYGHRMSTEYYKDIRMESAEQIFVVGLRSLTAHDAINVECMDSICKYLAPFKGQPLPHRITCVFEDLDTYSAFKTSEIFSLVRELDIEFVPYNFYSGWAKQIFIKRCHKDKDDPVQHSIQYPTVYGKGITPDDKKYVHLVFVGTTNFAVAFAMEAAHVLHFPNFNKDHRLKTRITFIDLNADKEKDLFITRNRHFFELQSHYYKDLTIRHPFIHEVPFPPLCLNCEKDECQHETTDFLDIDFKFIKGDIFSQTVQDEITKWSNEHDKEQYLSIFLAMADQRQNFVMGMNMPDAVYEKSIPIFIRQDKSDNFVTNLRNADKKNLFTYSLVKENGTLDSKKRHARYANIYPFGMNEASFSTDEVSLKRAKLINYLYKTANYDTYKFQGILALDAMSEDKLWEEANAYWGELSVALKWSSLYSAYTIRTKLDILRAMRGLNIEDRSHDTWSLSEDEVETMAQIEHNRWNVEKLLMGYRKARKKEDKYAYPVFAGELSKNKNLFIHHDIRPFEDLGEIKELDREFSRYIPWIMKMTEKP